MSSNADADLIDFLGGLLDRPTDELLPAPSSRRRLKSRLSSGQCSCKSVHAQFGDRLRAEVAHHV